jgi:hypothetical protein
MLATGDWSNCTHDHTLFLEGLNLNSVLMNVAWLNSSIASSRWGTVSNALAPCTNHYCHYWEAFSLPSRVVES